MRLRTAMIGIATLLMASPAFASQWRLVYLTDDKPNRTVILVDRSSIAEDGFQTKNFWQFTYVETPSVTLQYAKSVRSHVRVSCAQHKLGVYSIVQYNRNNDITYNQEGDPNTAKLHDVVPDTMGERVFEFVCEGKDRFDMPVPDNLTPSKYSQIFLDVLDKKK